MTEKKTDNDNPKRFGAGITRRRVIIAATAVIAAWGIWYFARINTGYSSDRPAWVHIPHDATREAARDSIISALGNRFGQRVAAMWNGNIATSHGAYRIDPGEKAWQVARKIGRGRQTPVKIAFNNIRTLDQLANLLASRMDFTADNFMATCDTIQQTDTITRRQLEAQFLPDTYEVYWSASPRQLINKIRRNYIRFWNGERLDKAKALSLTPLQVSILASIIEEESNRRDERPKIARLYLNRLHRGMPLQADPTVKFATGNFAARRITADMLSTDSPYNTYKVNGLPPGIIRMPEARTIDDVLNAPTHNYIYMCARPDGSGYHDFTADYTTHLANARAYRKAIYGTR